MPTPSTEPGAVNGVGATRRIRGLWRIGYMTDDLAVEYSVARSLLDSATQGTPTVSLRLHQTIDTMWRDLKEIPGMHWGAIAQAMRRNWVPAYLWHVDMVDDPTASIPGFDSASAQVRVSEFRSAVRDAERSTHERVPYVSSRIVAQMREKMYRGNDINLEEVTIPQQREEPEPEKKGPVSAFARYKI
jgi:hypothetical protein